MSLILRRAELIIRHLQFTSVMMRQISLIADCSVTVACFKRWCTAYTQPKGGGAQNRLTCAVTSFSAHQVMKHCLNQRWFSLAVLSASAIRLHTAGTRRVGVQARGRHHRNRPIRPTLVDRRDGEPQGSLSSYLRRTLPYIGLCPFLLTILQSLSLTLSREVLLNLVCPLFIKGVLLPSLVKLS